MSIKSADVLRKLIMEDGSLLITPLLTPDVQLSPGSGSIDLRLGTRFIVNRRGDLAIVDIAKDTGKQIVNLQDSYYVGIGDSFVLHPNHFVLASTLEYLCLPNNLAGNVVTRSSWGRYGLVIATAVAIHPGFVGPLTLELRNLAEVPLALYPGRRILQVFFHEIEQIDPDAFDQSAYLGTTKPSPGEFGVEEAEAKAISKFSDYDKHPFVAKDSSPQSTDGEY